MQRNYLYFLAVAHLCCDINMGALPAILPFLATHYHFDYQALSGFVFASAFMSTLVQPLFGYLADKKANSYFMVVGVLVGGIAFGLIGELHNYWHIFLAITLMGVGSAIFHPEAARLVNAISGVRKGLGMSIFSVGGNGGFSIGPVVAVMALSYFGMSGMGVFALISVIMSIILLVFVPKIQKRAQDCLSENTPKESIPNTSIHTETKKNNWPAFLKLSVVIVGRSCTFCILTSFLPLYCIHSLHQDDIVGGTILTIFSIIGVFSTLVGGFLADSWGYIKMIRLSMLAMVILLALLPCVGSMWEVYLLIVPIAIALFGSYSSYVVLGQTYLAKSIGFASGITLGVAFSIGGMLVPAFGWLADYYGLLSVMQLNVALAFICTVGSFFLPKLKCNNA